MSSSEADSFPPLVPVPLFRATWSSAPSPVPVGLVPALPLEAVSPELSRDLAVERQKYAHLVAFLEDRGYDLRRIKLGRSQDSVTSEALLPLPSSELSVPVGLELLPPAPLSDVARLPPVVPTSGQQDLLVGSAVPSSAVFGPHLDTCADVQSLPCSDTGLTLVPPTGVAIPASAAEFENLSNSKSPALGPPSFPDVQGSQPTWSRVVQGVLPASPSVVASAPASAAASASLLQFFPPASTAGNVIIKPPQEVLMKGNNLWATSLIGGFLHSRLPFKQVESFAFRAWGGLGLQKVFLHAKGYFVFKFSSAADRDNVLALGPWYISNKLLLLQHWKEGADFSQVSVQKIPIWVKLHHVPYAYWSSEGLSYLASGIGNPLFLDTLTAKLEPLPYARVCIEIQAGANLPAKLFATNLDVDSGEETLIEVQVEYQSKPQSCAFCSSFGHSQFKCPRANFQWVPKPSAGTEARSPMAAASSSSPKAAGPKADPTGSTALPKAGPKAGPKALPKDGPKALPKDGPKDGPKALPKDGPKDGLKALPKDGPVDGPQALPKDGPIDGPKALPKACSRPGGLPEGLSASSAAFPIPSVGFPLALREADRCSSNPFSILADDASVDVLSEAEPLKAADEAEGRAMPYAAVGPPLRSQSKPKKKKKKSPMGKKSS